MAAKTKPRRSSTSSPSAAQRLAEFADFCAELRTESGAPFELHPFQRTIVKPYFEGATETAVLLPKGNGKSTLMAAVAIYHLLVTPNAECLIAAAARDQAEIILRQSRMFIRSNPSLAKLLDIQQRQIVLPGAESRIRVLASDSDNTDGVIPTLAIVDELHRHRDGNVYDNMRKGLPKRHGQLITISTAGATQASPLGQLRLKAHTMPGFKRSGKHNTVTSANGNFVFHEWCLDPADDPDDMKVVKQANPAPWHTIDALQELHDAPTTTPYSWLRFECGVWTEGAEPWIEPAKWDALAGELAEGDCVLGVRVGPGHEDAALVRLVLGEVLSVHHTIMKLENESPLSQVEDAVREAVEEFNPRTVAYTSTTFRRSAEVLEAEGIDVVEVPYTPVRMMQVSETLLKLIEERRLVHDGSDALRASVLAARTKQTERGWRFAEEQQQGTPISALLALAVAAEVAESEATPVEPMFAFT